MSQIDLIRRFLWVLPVLLGLVFIASGGYMIAEGREAKEDVHQALIAEKVVTPEDATIPEALVHDVSTADAQADIIREHSLNTTEGMTYAELDREDPNRDVYLTGVTLRTALNLAVMGFKISDLVVGLGVFMIVVGASNALLLAPAMYWMRTTQPAVAGAVREG
jgi:hypothetical protein